MDNANNINLTIILMLKLSTVIILGVIEAVLEAVVAMHGNKH